MTALTAGGPHALTTATHARLAQALEDSLAPATRRVYRTAWAAWTDWAGAHDTPALPATPEALATYLAARATDGASLASLRLITAAVGQAHKLAGEPNPAAHALVQRAMAGFARQARGKPVKQARPLDRDAVTHVRGYLNGQVDKKEKVAVTMLAVSILAACGLRRSELARLTWDDIVPGTDGAGTLIVRYSKTDQTGGGQIVAVPAQIMQDLDRVARLRGHRDGLVIGLSPSQIHRRIQSVCKAAGLGEGYGAHSGRVGMACQMVKAGAPLPVIQGQGRWTGSAMPARYAQAVTATEALRYL